MTAKSNFIAAIINQENQVAGVKKDLTMYPFPSKFGIYDISLSEDDVTFAVSDIPDPDGGGALLYYLTEDNDWAKLDNGNPGARKVCGTGIRSCLYISEDDNIYSMNTQAQGQLVYDGLPILELAYGGGMLWGVLPDKTGGMPQLHWSKYSAGSPINWNLFPGNYQPTSLAANEQGDAYGIESGLPYGYIAAKGQRFQFGAMPQPNGMEITFKNWSYVLTSNSSPQGNEVLKWVDEQGGVWQDAGFKATKVCAVY